MFGVVLPWRVLGGVDWVEALPVLALLAAAVPFQGCYNAAAYVMASVGERVIARIRRELYAHIQSMPLAFFASLHSAELMTRVVTDVNRLARLSSTVLVMAVRHVGTIAALLTVMFLREWVLALIAFAVFPAVGVAVRTIGRKLEEAIMAFILESRFGKADIMNAYINEIYLGQDGRRAVHGFGLAISHAAKIEEDVERDFIMNAQQSKEYGIIDDIIYKTR